MKLLKYIVIKDKVCIGLSGPSFNYNGFAHGLHLKSHILLGKQTFAVSILGFGISVTWKRSPEVLWMWDSWKEKAWCIGCKKTQEI